MSKTLPIAGVDLGGTHCRCILAHGPDDIIDEVQFPTTSPDETGADTYLGIGAAPEGVIAAGVLRCIGGHMQGRLILDSHEKRERAARMGISDPNRKYELHDMARGDVIVAATGVTDGALLKGVRFKQGHVETETVVYRSATGTVRRIIGEHRRTRPFEG